MNDPHVKALYYWVNHDDSVDYDDADPLEHEHELFDLQINGRQVTIQPKNHYSTKEEAVAAVEGFIRHWEFEAALSSGSSRFSLSYMDADVIDRDPTPPPPGTVNISATFRSGRPTLSAKVRVGRKTYPSIPSGDRLDVSTPVVQAMLSQLDMYHKGRALLGPMVYFCLTTLQDSVPTGEGDADARTRDHYCISRKVLRQVRTLCSTKGGVEEGRKGAAVNANFTKEERAFLVAAIQAFTRRAAEKATNSSEPLYMITLKDLPKIHE